MNLRDVIDVTTKDIKFVQGMIIPKDELSEYWLRYSLEVPKKLRAQVSKEIFKALNVKVLWISGFEVNIKLYD